MEGKTCLTHDVLLSNIVDENDVPPSLPLITDGLPSAGDIPQKEDHAGPCNNNYDGNDVGTNCDDVYNDGNCNDFYDGDYCLDDYDNYLDDYEVDYTDTLYGFSSVLSDNQRESPYILDLDGFAEYMIRTEFWPAASLARLPLELISLIVHFLLNPIQLRQGYRDKALRKILARTSLVCHSWWIIQRPKLFHSLELRCLDDVRFLLEMLRNPNSHWLPAVVEELQLSIKDVSMDRYCRSVTSRFPSLRRFTISYLPPSTMPPSHPRCFLSPPGPFLVTCNNLKCISFTGISFFSLSALAHALEGMSSLEELSIQEISWANIPERPPTRMSLSSFPRLRRISGSGNYTEKLVWLYAPFLARHCRLLSKDVTLGNEDAALIVLLATFFIAIPCIPEITVIYGAALIDAHTLQLTSVMAHLFSCACEVQLWPSDCGATSAIRTVKLLSDSSVLKAGIDWSLVDSCFAQNAANLEAITIYSGSDSEISTHAEPYLPELWKLGKLIVKSKAEWDGLYDQSESMPLISTEDLRMFLPIAVPKDRLRKKIASS